MEKIEIGGRNFMYPMPTTLVGADVDGKPNYLAVAHVGIMRYGTLSVSLNKRHHTNRGIRENGTFSVNLPSTRMMKETDYCGLVSGREVDKGSLFRTFYGKLKTAPMIRECPVNMECRLVRTLDLETHEVFIGDIAETYCDPECVTPGRGENLSRVDPILFSMSGGRYFRLGEEIGRAWNVGRELQTGGATLSPPPVAAKE